MRHAKRDDPKSPDQPVGSRVLRPDLAGLLARPATLGKNHTPLVGGAPKRACLFEGFIPFGTWGHLTRKLQRVGSGDVPVDPVR
jgi:hypothetical protein